MEIMFGLIGLFMFFDGIRYTVQKPNFDRLWKKHQQSLRSHGIEPTRRSREWERSVIKARNYNGSVEIVAGLVFIGCAIYLYSVTY